MTIIKSLVLWIIVKLKWYNRIQIGFAITVQMLMYDISTGYVFIVVIQKKNAD